MYKVMTLGTLVLGLALTPFFSSGGSTDTETADTVVNSRVVEDAGVVSQVTDEPDTSRACEWSCEVCEPGQGCTQTCTEVGACGSTCGFVMECEDGLRWDETECGCR